MNGNLGIRVGEEEKIRRKKTRRKTWREMRRKRTANELEERDRNYYKREGERWKRKRETELNVTFIEKEVIDTISN